MLPVAVVVVVVAVDIVAVFAVATIAKYLSISLIGDAMVTEDKGHRQRLTDDQQTDWKRYVGQRQHSAGHNKAAQCWTGQEKTRQD